MFYLSLNCAALGSFQQKTYKTTIFFFFSYSPFVISSHLGLFYHRHVCYPIIFELQVSGAACNPEYQIFKFILFLSALHHLFVICSMVGKQGAWV